MVKPGEIYFVDNVKLGEVEYGRPCLVLRASDHDATVCFFSTKFELLRAEGVTIFDSDPEFSKTGLKESCFIVPKGTLDVPLDFFKNAKRWGIATGEFKKKTEQWWGAELI